MAGEGALVPVDRPAADELRLALAGKSFEKTWKSVRVSVAEILSKI